MSKAMLIMNMPKSCLDCCMCQIASDSDLFCDGENFCCRTSNSVEKEVELGIRAEWCPLKEVPQKKEEIEMEISHAESVDMGYREGFNACIDEILEGSEENG